MQNNHDFMSLIVRERIDRCLQEAENYRLAQAASEDRTRRRSLANLGRRFLKVVTGRIGLGQRLTPASDKSDGQPVRVTLFW